MPDERFDVHLIAGFHHTHAPLACHALDAGAHAVVEKPLATTEAQLHDFWSAMQDTGWGVRLLPQALFAVQRVSP